MKHIISAADFTRDWLSEFLDRAQRLVPNAQSGAMVQPPLGIKTTLLFAEPSTRTCDSNDEAAQLLGCRIKTIAGSDATSLMKNEALAASTRMEAGYNADVLIMRTKIEGGARWVANMLGRYGYKTAVHNAGDGANQHPTQALLDLLTIHQKWGRIDNLAIGFVGDLKNSRTVHSLIQALRLCTGIRIVLVSSPEVALPRWYCDGNTDVVVTDNIEALRGCDIVYVTRVQRERFGSDLLAYERVRGLFTINAKVLALLGSDVKIMHPQPIGDNEVHPEIWEHPQVIMDFQAQMGVPARMAAIQGSAGCLDYVYQPEFPEPVLETQRECSAEEAIAAKHARNQYFTPITFGTVIDHIPNGLGAQIERIVEPTIRLGNGAVILLKNLRTCHGGNGHKDVLVIEGGFLSTGQKAMVEVVAPGAVFNEISDGRLKKQRITSVSFITAGTCPNKNCVTALDVEAALHPCFRLISGTDRTWLQCHYCEQYFGRQEIFL